MASPWPMEEVHESIGGWKFSTAMDMDHYMMRSSMLKLLRLGIYGKTHLTITHERNVYLRTPKLNRFYSIKNFHQSETWKFRKNGDLNLVIDHVALRVGSIVAQNSQHQ